MQPRCPHCDAEALYVGLKHLDCPTEGCPNHRPPERTQPELPGIDPDEFPFELFVEAHAFF